MNDLEQLAGWRAPDEDGHDVAAARERVRVRLDAHIAQAAPVASARRAPRRRRWWLVAAPGVALAAAIAVALVVSLGSGVEEGTLTPVNAAARVLDRAAGAAEARGGAGSPFPGKDQFFYIKTQATYLDESITAAHVIPSLDTRTREAWLSPTTSGELREYGRSTRWPSAKARQAWVSAGRPRLTGTSERPDRIGASDFYLGNERLTYEQLRDFDQSPQELYRRLREGYQDGQGGGRNAELFTQVADALREQPAPPKLRAALYRVLALIPGVQYLGRVHDRAGRPALAVGQVARGTRRELLFDPKTSDILAEREVMLTVPRGLKGLVPSGTVTTDAVYLRRAVVDRPGERP
jgi:hypothetical protein